MWDTICAGMAYIGGLLLMNMDEEDAFWALLSLCESPKYLAGYYDASMSRWGIRLCNTLTLEGQIYYNYQVSE